jgi:homoserine O-acetyltransferase/O-succinyltransferase
VTARTVVAPFSHDALFPVGDCEAERRLISDAMLQVVESPWGHFAWGMTDTEVRQIDGVLSYIISR